MNDRFDRLASLFERALELPPDERDAFVARVTAGDDALAAELHALLAHHHAAGAFIVPPDSGSRVAGRLAGEAAHGAGGESFGAWRIVRPIGEGGAGSVHLVERTVGGFAQRGALRLLRSALPSDERMRRFARERRILARLEHPLIARLLDGGVTASGMPWLVTEFVEGRPFYEWCSERARGVNERLLIFLRVCSAVQYAHQQLVLHGDLEPGRLRVAEDGTPRLLDFGLGRILGEDEASSGAATTSMAPKYASPEQLRGEPVTVAADVYALGVLLYELLTGAHPFPSDAGREAFEREVLEGDPISPSVAARHPAPAPAGSAGQLPSPPAGGIGALPRRLTGDLDNIVLRAIHREPARRYASVAELSEDLRRHLGGFPVQARPDTAGYRAAKFVGRNRLAIGAAALAALALLAGTGVATWQATIARRQAAIAEARFAGLRSLTQTLLFDVNDAIASLPGATPARERVVGMAARGLERMRADAGSDPATRLELAQAWLRLGTIQGEPWRASVGQPEDAYHSFQSARALLEGLERERPRDVGVVFPLMDACNRISLYDLEHGRPDEALFMQRRAVELNQRLVELAADTLRFRLGLPRRQHNLAMALHAAGRDSEALATVRPGVAGFADIVQRFPADPKHRAALAGALGGYAQILSDTRGPADSIEAVAHRSLALLEPLLAADPANLDLRQRIAANDELLAECASNRRAQPDSALAWAIRANAELHAVALADPGNADAAIGEAIGRVNLGRFLARAGREAEARTLLVRELLHFERLAAGNPPDTRLASEVIEAREALAELAGARARRLGSRPGAWSAWHEAAAHLDSAATALARLERAGDAWARERRRQNAEAPLRAACDSALSPRR